LTLNQPEIGGIAMKDGEKLVIVGCSGAGGPAAMMAKKLMPGIDVTVIRKEEFFIVR
jgi:D-arabinose 1-dehydrogenase-like Zn-dependent alcohol dehydrogenase